MTVVTKVITCFSKVAERAQRGRREGAERAQRGRREPIVGIFETVL